MAVLNTGLAKTSAGGFTIDYSCRFDGTASYFSRTPSSASNRKTWTLSLWYKRGKPSNQEYLLGAVTDIGGDPAVLSINEALFWHSGGSNYRFYTSAIYRDPSAWMHIVFSFDTSTAGGRAVADMMRIYVNGVLVTDKGSTTNPIVDYDGNINNDELHTIGRNAAAANSYCTGTIAEVHFIDGTALTPTSFGESGDYGEWKPIEVEGLTYGTNGYYLDFADSAALGNDVSGNNNDWTANSLAASDQMLDSPTNNFCTWNPLSINITNYPAHQEGNLKTYLATSGSPKGGTLGTMSMASGKWYWEVLNKSVAEWHYIGIVDDVESNTGTIGATLNPTNGIAYTQLGKIYKNGVYDGNAVATYSSDGEVLGFAYDADANTIKFYNDDVLVAESSDSAHRTPSTPVGNYTPSIVSMGSTAIANFGQDSSFAGEKTAQGETDSNGYGDFYYEPPADYLALCTANLDTPAVTPSEHFNTILYTGNGVSGRGITGVGFQPDFLWVKARSAAYSNRVTDALIGATNSLITNSTGAIATDDVFDSLDSDGFTVGNDAGSNADTKTYVAWNWKANGSGSSNTDGSINTTATSANTDAGFSISTYQGNDTVNATVGHGLSKAPELVIIKDTYTTGAWEVYEASTDNKYRLNETGAGGDDFNFNYGTNPSATVVNLSSGASINRDPDTYVMYCWHSVDGYSKVGSYEGNDDADGTFIYLGFRPKYFMIKAATTTDGWVIYDSARDSDGTTGFNKGTAKMRLFADNDPAETEIGTLDFLSNGIKIRASGLAMNEEHTYIYLAFAETPFKYANGK